MQRELFQPHDYTQPPKRVKKSEVAQNFMHTEAETVNNGVRLRLATNMRNGSWCPEVQVFSPCENQWLYLQDAPDRQTIIDRLDRSSYLDFYLTNLGTLYVERMEIPVTTGPCTTTT